MVIPNVSQAFLFNSPSAHGLLVIIGVVFGGLSSLGKMLLNWVEPFVFNLEPGMYVCEL